MGSGGGTMVADYDNLSVVSSVVVPEPSTLALAAAGLIGLGAVYLRRK
jgi:hypothetical protein